MLRVSWPTRRVTRDTLQPTPLSQRASRYVMEMQLAKLLRRRIVVLGPQLLGGEKNQETLQTVTLVGVDQAGIWIESEEAANRIADKFRVKPAAPSAFFIPFAQITTIIASVEPADAGEISPEVSRNLA